MISLIHGDAMEQLKLLPDGCIQCTVTSPPYYGLRNYGVDGQIGLEATPEQFIQKMVEVFREVRRVTRDDGVLWLNLGDSYAGSWGNSGRRPELDNTPSEQREKNTKYFNRRGWDERRERPASSYNILGYKPKDLYGIPWRVAFALQADGWYFRSAIPWIKRNCMPESVKDRPTSAIEYIFLMAKSARYFYDGEAIRRPASYSTDERKGRAQTDHKSMPTNERNGIRPKKQDQTGNPTYTGFNERWKEGTRRTRAGSNGQQIHPEGITHDLGDSATRNYRNSDPFFESWQGLYSESENPLAFIINPQARPELHFATFPDLLAATCIKAGSKDGDTILDPFGGSGTTAVMAESLGRNCILIELNYEYIRIARKRVGLGCLPRQHAHSLQYNVNVMKREVW